MKYTNVLHQRLNFLLLKGDPLWNKSDKEDMQGRIFHTDRPMTTGYSKHEIGRVNTQTKNMRLHSERYDIFVKYLCFLLFCFYYCVCFYYHFSQKNYLTKYPIFFWIQQND